MTNNYEKLEVYKISYKTALDLHFILIDEKRKKTGLFDLLDQASRSSKSIPANIAEGYGKNVSGKEFKRYLWIAVGSKDELVVHLSFLKDLKFLSETEYRLFYEKYDQIGKMLFGLIKSIKD